MTAALSDESELILAYYREDRRLMDEYLQSSPYRSLKPNRLSAEFLHFHEKELTPLLAASRIRVWHYTRLTDDEVVAIERLLIPSSLDFLWTRLQKLVASSLVSEEDAKGIYSASPFQSQSESRAKRLWTTLVPLHPSDSGVSPLLEHWGGESAYFWLKEGALLEKLRGLGAPRIIEIETAITERLTAFPVAETVLRAWARNLGEPLSIPGCDLAINEDIDSARVLRVHTEGVGRFCDIAETYPEGARALLRDPEPQ